MAAHPGVAGLVTSLDLTLVFGPVTGPLPPLLAHVPLHGAAGPRRGPAPRRRIHILRDPSVWDELARSCVSSRWAVMIFDQLGIAQPAAGGRLGDPLVVGRRADRAHRAQQSTAHAASTPQRSPAPPSGPATWWSLCSAMNRMHRLPGPGRARPRRRSPLPSRSHWAPAQFGDLLAQRPVLLAIRWGPFRGVGPSAEVSFPRVRRVVSAETRAVAQFGRALPWGCRGRRFECCQPDFDFMAHCGARQVAVVSCGAILTSS